MHPLRLSVSMGWLRVNTYCLGPLLVVLQFLVCMGHILNHWVVLAPLALHYLASPWFSKLWFRGGVWPHEVQWHFWRHLFISISILVVAAIGTVHSSRLGLLHGVSQTSEQRKHKLKD